MFRVRRHDIHSVRWWYARRKEIDFNPSYQREGNIWSDSDKAYLVDSIINSYDVPKIYFADFTYQNSPLNQNGKLYAIIDGKQRMQAIVDFFENKISLNRDFIYLPDPSLRLAGLTFSDLKKNYPEVAEKFDDFSLDIMSVLTDEESKIQDLFVRLNRSKPLTGAELRNAMQGDAPNLIRHINDNPFFTTRISFRTSRGQSKNTAAKLLLLEYRGKLVDTKKINLDKFVKEVSNSDDKVLELLHTSVNNVYKVLADMCDVFIDKDPLLSTEGPITIYYWFLREHGYQGNIRAFLVSFEQGRTAKKEEYSQYNLLSRSINDAGSLIARFDILNEFYRKYNAGVNIT